MEVPSMKNKLYPTMIKNEVEKAEKYIDSLPKINSWQDGNI